MVARLFLLVALVLALAVADVPNFDEMVNRVMNGFEQSYKRSINKGALANWVFSTNVTDSNSRALVRVNNQLIAERHLLLVTNNSYTRNKPLEDWLSFQFCVFMQTDSGTSGPGGVFKNVLQGDRRFHSEECDQRAKRHAKSLG